MYESLPETQNSIVYAEVNGFVEKKFWFSADYLFVVEVYWSDNRTTYIKRNYKEFLQFHRQVSDYFRSKHEKGIVTTPVYIPKISGKYLGISIGCQFYLVQLNCGYKILHYRTILGYSCLSCTWHGQRRSRSSCMVIPVHSHSLVWIFLVCQ